MNNAKTIVAGVLCLAAAGMAGGVTLKIDKVQQRYPWNGIVDIDYTVTYGEGEEPLDPANDRLVLSFVNEDASPVTTNIAYTLDKCPTPAEAGSHRISWNANADGVNFTSQNVKARLAVSHYAPRYMVIDVSKLNGEGKFDVEYLAGEPADGFNQPEYKGNKIVLRLIPPGSFMAGSPTTETGRPKTDNEYLHKVTISRPFYMAIFEITQMQYSNVLCRVTNPAYSINPSILANQGPYRPVTGIRYFYARGTHASYGWPTKTTVAGNTFIGILRDKTGFVFDLPTEAQWEYACRAGTTTPYNSTEDLTKIARYSGNNTSGEYSSGPATVGSYLPNAWGLYDMHGNVQEWCLDNYYENLKALGQQVDPPGPPVTSSDTGTLRGGNFGNGAAACRSAARESRGKGNTNDGNFGIRLTCALP